VREPKRTKAEEYIAALTKLLQIVVRLDVKKIR
jgi:hypothetical protein